MRTTQLFAILQGLYVHRGSISSLIGDDMCTYEPLCIVGKTELGKYFSSNGNLK